jgi:hypothetical protein
MFANTQVFHSLMLKCVKFLKVIQDLPTLGLSHILKVNRTLISTPVVGSFSTVTYFSFNTSRLIALALHVIYVRSIEYHWFKYIHTCFWIYMFAVFECSGNITTEFHF